ncbi:MAG: hypothetical protein H6737_26970 [Alphaproteobacteria bacterium]|nr:hypothetical protein [Alphaproteobacteria bacterium]
MKRLLPALLLVACGPKIDPLHPLKAEVQEARRAGPDGTPPHVRVTLAEKTAGELLQTAIGKPITVPVMLGTAAVVTPTIDLPDLGVTASRACDCPRAEVSLRGSFDVELRGLLGKQKLADDLGFEAAATGSLALSFDRKDDAGAPILALEPVPQDPWDIRITLDEQQGMIDDELVRKQVSQPLADLLAKPLVLATLPKTLPVKPVKAQLEVADHPTAALWLRAKPAEAPPEVSVESGWAIASTETAVTSAARAAFAALEQPKKWKLEPLGLTVGEDATWEADLRLHKVARKAKLRDYHAKGELIIGERIEVKVTSMARTAKRGWGGSITALFIDGRLRQQAMRLALSEPATRKADINGIPMDLTVTRITSEGTGVFVYGTLQPSEEEPEEAQ